MTLYEDTKVTRSKSKINGHSLVPSVRSRTKIDRFTVRGERPKGDLSGNASHRGWYTHGTSCMCGGVGVNSNAYNTLDR